MDDDLELTAYHEAGHAVVAAYAGGRVLSVTITPDWDDGPRRFGDTRVAWSRRRFAPAELAEKLALVALAGPVAEGIYRGEPLHPAHVPEWGEDWRQAWNETAVVVADEKRRTGWLEARLVGLRGLLSEGVAWEAVAGVADHLLAHETLEADDFAELVATWLR